MTRSETIATCNETAGNIRLFSSKNRAMLDTKNPDDMKTLSSCLNKVVKEGYTENFKILEEGLKSLESDKIYQPDEVQIVNFFRFEGVSDPSDMSILYVIEANDNVKGTLIDAYGAYADQNIDKFIKEVESINKKNTSVLNH
jgi:hypothetical protein